MLKSEKSTAQGFILEITFLEVQGYSAIQCLSELSAVLQILFSSDIQNVGVSLAKDPKIA